MAHPVTLRVYDMSGGLARIVVPLIFGEEAAADADIGTCQSDWAMLVIHPAVPLPTLRRCILSHICRRIRPVREHLRAMPGVFSAVVLLKSAYFVSRFPFTVTVFLSFNHGLLQSLCADPGCLENSEQIQRELHNVQVVGVRAVMLSVCLFVCLCRV